LWQIRGDREIYYYQEGLAAPMGSFSNYKRQPRAVMVVRRDLRERQPGVYETNVELGRPGAYDLVFRLDRPAGLPLLSIRGRGRNGAAGDPGRARGPAGATPGRFQPVVR
jgi:hypothetical protein